ncbi:immunoglobulin lambda-1 light chain-like [Micropterus salmoides]|uniref:immunoglobulin lambda-1 light chain-like n=1 Tax=Micropterus salmoides TaxID=27706 RepID=UPI0018EAB3B7|nr:immunoglobulin lambda-1 light chain-like [Micropterus salmoides]
MAAELIQDDLTLTRRVGENVSFSCRGTDQCDYEYVGWRQKKDTETFTVILAIQKSNVCFTVEANKPYGIFGSGTKLYVTDNPVVKPVVSVYPAASRAHHEGKSSLLCVASNMFPPLVRFSWKRRKVNESLEEQAPAEEELAPAEEEQAPAEEVQLELRESGRTAAIRVIDRDALDTYKYRCYVQHEGGEVEAQTEQEVPVASCPPEREPADLAALQQADLSFQSQCRVKLLWLLYTVLIVKSLVYCCGLSLL